MSDEFFERRVGTVIKGKWTLEKLLGIGGMAAVYLARHHIGRTDAIKIMHPSAARSSELRARFEQEARAVSKLGHPGAARIDDIDKTEDGSLFMVMELLDGESLAERLERGGATVADALAWAEELLDVVAAAHELGIVHRDIKPDNVFLLKDGRVKLLDFGVAHVHDAEALKTVTGVALGTLPYMAPEQVRGEKVDARVDLFAIGATIVRAIARRPIQEAASEAELYMKMGTQPAPPARALLPSAPDSLWPIIDHALAFDRERRYATAAAMRSDVQAVRARRLPAHALASARAEPTLVGASPTVDGPSPTFAGTVRMTVADRARTTIRRVAASPRGFIAVLAGSVALGVALTVVVLLLVRSDDADAKAASASAAAPAAPASVPSARRPALVPTDWGSRSGEKKGKNDDDKGQGKGQGKKKLKKK
jgi:serine/threonine protein kinase